MADRRNREFSGSCRGWVRIVEQQHENDIDRERVGTNEFRRRPRKRAGGEVLGHRQ
jgi:hypothetical protein